MSNPVQSTIEKVPQAIKHTISVVPKVVDQATPHFPEAVGYAFLAAYLILMAATAIVWVRKALKPEREYTELKLRNPFMRLSSL